MVDASALERSLYLTLQLLELGKPVVMALNMMDIVEKRGMEIDLHRFPEMLGIPVVPVSARKRRGLDALMHAAQHHVGQTHPDRLIHEHSEVTHHAHDHHDEYTMVYSDAIEDKIDQIIPELARRYPDMKNLRWHALKLLESDKEVCEKYPVNLPDALDRSYESDIINQKYDFNRRDNPRGAAAQAEAGRAHGEGGRRPHEQNLGHPRLPRHHGADLPAHLHRGRLAQGWLELAIDWLSGGVESLLGAVDASAMLTSLVVDGIIAGVGTIVTFLPNILILFLCLALLEDSGYMARVAYVMEGIMSRLGLSGKAFIPMLLGFGCTVPAIMASRALENKRDRYKVMLVTPFMSCNARLTIYILFAEMFFGDRAMIVAYSMYLIGIVVAIIVSAIIHLLDRKKSVNYLMIELPEYKLPDSRTVAIYVWEKVKDYLGKAGTDDFPRHDDNLGAAELRRSRLRHGYVRELRRGHRPRARAGLRAGGPGLLADCRRAHRRISAKEVVVSSCAVLFGIVNASSPEGMAEFSAALSGIGFGPLNALCLMVFCLLYIPCTATLATVRRESSTRYMFATAAFQLVVAWVVTLLVYQIGLLVI